MRRNSCLKQYDIDKLSIVDIEKLIDKGYRFKLVSDLDPEEYDDVEESLNE